VAYVGDRRGTYGILFGKPEEGEHMEDVSIDGRIILK
jgi:hypothetical protein